MSPLTMDTKIERPNPISHHLRRETKMCLENSFNNYCHFFIQNVSFFFYIKIDQRYLKQWRFKEKSFWTIWNRCGRYQKQICFKPNEHTLEEFIEMN